jgi:DMSO/TMAO reductase YedYZ molybdopterin-dependent catalytic subunit
MKKATKIALVILILLVAAAVPLYYYTRPASNQPGTIEIMGNVADPMNVTLSQLKSEAPVTLQVTLTSSGSPSENGVYNFTGIPLSTLLQQAHISANATSVYIQASDGYGTSISMQDAMNQSTIIAYAKDGSPLAPLKSGGEGPLRLVIGTDQFAQRWVKGVVAIQVT